MLKSSQLSNAQPERTTEVPLHVLESIINGNYDTILSEQEKRVLEAVPPNFKQWFEKFVIGGFYLMARHITRKGGARPPKSNDPDFTLLEMLIAQLLPRDETNRVHAKGPMNLRETYLARQKYSISRRDYISNEITFETAVADKLMAYSEDMAKTVVGHYEHKLPFIYEGTTKVIESLKDRVLN